MKPNIIWFEYSIGKYGKKYIGIHQPFILDDYILDAFEEINGEGELIP